MADVSAIRRGIQTRLATIAGLRASAEWPDQINVPAAWPKPVDGPGRAVLGGHDLYRLSFEIVVVAAPAQLGIALGQQKLAPYLATSGDESIRAALEADRTLDGSAAYLFVQPAAIDGALALAGQEWIAARIPVEVWAT